MGGDEKKYTVLGHGEKYISEYRKQYGPPGPPSFKRTLDETRAHLAPQVGETVLAASKLKEGQRLDEVVIELRLDEKFLAKSHHPEELIKRAGLNLRGAATWQQTVEVRPRGKARHSEPPSLVQKSSRSLLVSGTDSALKNLEGAITRGISGECDNDIRKIEAIRLPTREDRLRPGLADLDAPEPVEIVLYDWDPKRRDVAVRKLLPFLEGVGEDQVHVRPYDGGPTFIAAIVRPARVPALGDCNFLRAARLLPRMDLTRTSHGPAAVAPKIPRAATPKTWLAMFDGGFEPSLTDLAQFVRAEDLTTVPPKDAFVEHGTGVAGAAVFGHVEPGAPLSDPTCGVLAYRVLPDPLGDIFEMVGVVDAIERKVPVLPKGVKVINLSLGPPGPIDDVPSRFTYAIDRLARKHAKLFVTAVGNWGARVGEDRIQAPADSVNNLAVGAVSLADGTLVHAPYSCRGPGRPGGVVKPDVVAFGGCASTPFFVFDPDPGLLCATSGTSFAAPVVASLAARAFATVDGELTPEAVRALLIHSAKRQAQALPEGGHGVVAANLRELLACSSKRVSVLYQGDVSPRRHWKLPFLLPPIFDPGGKVAFEWTLVYTPETDHSSPDEYTLACVEAQFRPHSELFMINPPRGSPAKAVRLNIRDDALQVAKLEAAGWRRSPIPWADSSGARREDVLRSADSKWETVVRDARRKEAASISAPMLTVTIVGRGDWDRADPRLVARFAAVLTVHAPSYKGDLYADVVRTFSKLKPLAISAEVPARVRT